MVSDKAGRPQKSLGSVERDIFSLHCFDTVDWATGRASGL